MARTSLVLADPNTKVLSFACMNIHVFCVCVCFCAQDAGWRVTKGKRWTVCWGDILNAAEFAVLHEFQRVNHFPGRYE
jgi:hypothetical protein